MSRALSTAVSGISAVHKGTPDGQHIEQYPNRGKSRTSAAAHLVSRLYSAELMPKKAPKPFDVDGVQCSVKGELVNVGLNPGWDSDLRFPVKVKPTGDIAACKEKVRAHSIFAACKAQMGEPAVCSHSDPPDESHSRTLCCSTAAHSCARLPHCAKIWTGRRRPDSPA